MKVYDVTIKHNSAPDEHHYFGSKAAIFEEFSKETLGIGRRSLQNINLKDNPYENSKCIIRQGTVVRKGRNE